MRAERAAEGREARRGAMCRDGSLTCPQIKLDWLYSFVAVEEYGGFSAAAAVLHRSQPRLSVQVAELERVLGAKLFDRSVHPVVLTPEGRTVLPEAKVVLRSLTAIGVGMASSSDITGEVRLGVYPSAGAVVFPPLVAALASAHPRLRVVLWEGSTLLLEEALLNGEIDLAIRATVPMPEGGHLTHEYLWREPLVAIVPAGDELTRRTHVPLEDIARRPLVTIGDAFGRAGSHFEAHAALEEAGVDANIVYQTSEPQTLVSIVRHGLGVGLTNALAVVVSNTDGVEVVPVNSSCERRVALWWRHNPSASAARDAVRAGVGHLGPVVQTAIDAWSGGPHREMGMS